VVLWRSLRDAPSCGALLEDCLKVLAPQPLREVLASLEGRLSLLMEHLRDRRVLLVLDNLETLLEEGESRGRLRSGYEGYGQLLHRVGETTHQGCLLLTSREKLTDLEPQEGSRRPVRTLRLDGLETAASPPMPPPMMLTWSACFSISSLSPVLHRCIWCSQMNQSRNYLHLI